MVGILWISFVIAALFPISLTIDVCGLENVRRCESPSEINCVENLYNAITVWALTYEAVGYFVRRIDPLVLNKITFEGEDGLTVNLGQVTINGLGSGVADFRSVKEFPEYYRFEIAVNFPYLAFDVDNYNIARTDGCTVYNTDDDLGIQAVNFVVTYNAFLYKVRRCTGQSYLNVSTAFLYTNGNLDFSRAALKCDGQCAASFRDAFGRIIVPEFAALCNDLYNKVPSEVFYERIDIQDTYGFNQNQIEQIRVEENQNNYGFNNYYNEDPYNSRIISYL